MSGQRVEVTPSGKPLSHGGSGTAYASYGCRCDECKAANTARIKRRRVARNPDDAPAGAHGKTSTYVNWGCRCAPCTAAHAKRCAAYYQNVTRKLSG